MSKLKRLGAALVAVSLALGLSGCERLLEGEWSSSREHRGAGEETAEDSELTLEAQDYESLYDAVRTFVDRGVERGAIQMASYAGDMEADLAEAVFTASNETPEGAYCVYYINYSLARLLSVYEASVSIIYRHTPEELEKIGECADAGELDGLVLEELKKRSGLVTLRTDSSGVDEEAIDSAIERAYYENPGEILYIPTYSVTSYPETGKERILEISLSYPYAPQTLDNRERDLTGRVEKVAESLRGDTVSEKLMELGSFMAENVRYNESVVSSDPQSRRYTAMTAYGALVQGSAVGEGYAMAVKAVCDRLGIECTVVRGRHNNMDHAWNEVRLENGELYHLDCSAFDPEGAVFQNDVQHRYANYWWDEKAYEPCEGESLYGPEFDPPAEPEAPDEPGEGESAGEDTGPADEPAGGKPGESPETDTPTDPVTPEPEGPEIPETPENGAGAETETPEPEEPGETQEPEGPGEAKDPEEPEGPAEPEVPEGEGPGEVEPEQGPEPAPGEDGGAETGSGGAGEENA